MKNFSNIVLILFTLCFSIQESHAWEYRINGTLTITPLKPVELDNGDILIGYREARQLTLGIWNFKILRLSSEGKFISQIDVAQYFSNRPTHGTTMQLMDGKVLVSCRIQDSLTDYPGLLQFDQELNLLWDTTYTSLDSVVFTDVYKDVVHNRIWINGYKMLKPTKGVILQVVLDMSLHLNYVNVCNVPASNKMVPLLSQQCIFGAATINQAIFDSQFNPLHQKNLPPSQTVFSYHVEYNSSSMLFAAERREYDSTSYESDLYIMRVDTQLNVVDSMMRITKDVDERPAYVNSLIVTDNSIYLGGTYNSNAAGKHFPLTTQKRPYMLLKLDKDLNIQWEKIYRDDGSYILFHIIQTKDKGILLVGQIYDWLVDSTRKELDTYILKVDEQGETTGLDELNASHYSEVKVFPNPAEKTLFYSWPESLEIPRISVFDIQGKKMQVPATIDRNLLDISGLSTGIYIVEFKSSGYSKAVRFVKH